MSMLEETAGKLKICIMVKDIMNLTFPMVCK